MRSTLTNFITPDRNDPDEIRRRGIVGTLSFGLLVLSLLALVAILVFLFNNPEKWRQQDNQLTVISAGVAVFASLGIIQLNKRSSRVASLLLLLLLVTVSTFSDTPEQLSNGRSLFIFTIPIAISSLILAPTSSFFFAFINTLIVTALANQSDTVPNITAIVGFFMLALISWLSSRNLEQALLELRVINAELDQRVIERTRELSESLSREAAQASQREAILNSIADGVVVFDKNRTAIVANPSITSLTGKTQESIIGQEIASLVNSEGLPVEQRGRISEIFSQSGSVPTFRVNWGRKTLSVNAAEVKDVNSQSMGTVAVFRDITREAELEKMKDTFLAVVSHELRTPLNAILGFAEMIKETVYGPVNENQRKASVRIMDNTQRLLSIVSELLDQAQIQSGRMKINYVPCKPADLLTDLRETMEKIAESKGIKLHTELATDMPNTLNGDPQRLQQIMINLTNNAFKFSDKGKEVRVSIGRMGDQKWQIQVTDRGEGIPPEAIDYVFDTFRQVEGSATRKHGGVGLGLSIVKQLTELMGGTIVVASQVGAGSVFTVSLPLNTQ